MLIKRVYLIAVFKAILFNNFTILTAEYRIRISVLLPFTDILSAYPLLF